MLEWGKVSLLLMILNSMKDKGADINYQSELKEQDKWSFLAYHFSIVVIVRKEDQPSLLPERVNNHKLPKQWNQN